MYIFYRNPKCKNLKSYDKLSNKYSEDQYTSDTVSAVRNCKYNCNIYSKHDYTLF